MDFIDKNDDSDTMTDDSDEDEDEDYEDEDNKNDHHEEHLSEIPFAEGLKKIKKYDFLISSETVISTITLTCFLNRKILVSNIIKYFDDYDDFLIHKVYGGICYSANGKVETIKMKKMKKKNNFSNVSFIFDTYKLMGIKSDGKQKKINVKLFYSGVMHMTGCHDLSNVIKCLTIILDKLTKIKKVNSTDIYFVEDININMNNISNLVVQMMNTSSHSDYSIDLDETYNVIKTLQKNEHSYIIDKSFDHKKVLVKLMLDNVVSLFIFDAGSINISSKNFKDLIRAYEIINHILFHYNLYKNPIDSKIIVDFIKNSI